MWMLRLCNAMQCNVVQSNAVLMLWKDDKWHSSNGMGMNALWHMTLQQMARWLWYTNRKYSWGKYTCTNESNLQYA